MMNIKIEQNSDCFVEILELKEMLKNDPEFVWKDFTNREVVEIAVNELYDRIKKKTANITGG